MKNRKRFKWIGVFLMLVGLHAIEGYAAEVPRSLDELFDQVRQERIVGKKANSERETRFLAARDQRAQILQAARARLESEEKRSRRQKENFDRNEVRISAFETQLEKEAGSLVALFGVVRQHAREAEGNLGVSLVSAEKPGRSENLRVIAQDKRHPSIEKMEQLWLSLFEEMSESGKVVRFTAPVISSVGETEEKEVIRIGLFNAVSEGRYLNYLPESGKLATLSRQPSSRFTGMAKALE